MLQKLAAKNKYSVLTWLILTCS